MEVAEVLKSLLVLNQKKTLGFREQKMLGKSTLPAGERDRPGLCVNELLIDEKLLLALSEAGLKFPDIAGEA